jgi:hypothetical protein
MCSVCCREGLLYDFRSTHPHKLHIPAACVDYVEVKRNFEGWDVMWVQDPAGVTHQGNVFPGIPLGSRGYLDSVVEKAAARLQERTAMVLALAPPQEAVMMVQGCIIPSLDYT